MIDPASYQTGYADAIAGVKSRYPVSAVSPAPASRPVVRLAPRVLWQPVLDSLKPGTLVQLDPGGTYLVPSVAPIVLKVPGVTIDAQGAMVHFAVASSSIFRVQAAGVTVKNMQVSAGAGNVLFRVYAPDFSAISNTLLGAVATFALVDMGGIDATFSHNTVAVTESCSFYTMTEGTVLVGNIVNGSIGEVGVRVDCDDNHKLPARIVIRGNSLHSTGTNLKGCCEIRMAGPGCVFEQNKCYDYVRVGQDGPVRVGQCIDGLLLRQNRWGWLPPTSIRQHLMLKGGSVISVSDNDFLVDSMIRVASVSGPSQVDFARNRLHASAVGVTPKAIYDAATLPADCQVTDDGGTVVPFGPW